jgi:hypothetical protein
MFRVTFRAMTKASDRRKNRNALSRGPRFIDGAELLLMPVKSYLPSTWQYGAKFSRLKNLASLIAALGVGWIVYVMWFRDDEQALSRRFSEYVYVRDSSGDVVDLSHRRTVEAALRSRARVATYLDDE